MRYRFLCAITLGLVLLPSAMLLPLSGIPSLADETKLDFPIKEVAIGDLVLEVVVNSETFSQASAINSNGSIVGTREVMGAASGIISQKSFYFGIHGHLDMPLPASFTNVEVTGISDTELVIGYATRPIGHPDGNLNGVVWSPETGAVTVLPLPEGDSACHSQSVSADGKIVAGYSTGPSRLRPVLWTYEAESGKWSVTVLPTLHEHNPYLMSGRLQITPDGSYVAGCCTEAFLPNGVIDSSLYVWERADGGQWERSQLSNEQFYIFGINNKRELVGSMRSPTGKTLPVYFDDKGAMTTLDLLEGDIGGEARGINDQSVIVGFSDDPPGPDGGPEPCMWTVDGKVKRIVLGSSPYGVVQGINASGQLAGMATLIEEGAEGETEDVVERALAFRSKPK
ncbi:hypothetical protein SH449x_004662 [Pirellulaceae bacterium SH449]